MKLKKGEEKKTKHFKVWQIVLMVLCGIGLVCSFTLFLPPIQNLILGFGERLIHRTLNNPDVWIGKIVEIAFLFFIGFLAVLIAMIFSLINSEKGENQKHLKINNPINNLLKNPFLGIPIFYFVILIIGFTLMCLVYLLPTDAMKRNVKNSVSYFQISTEHGYQNPMFSPDSTLDDFTDALMLIEAAHKSDKPFPVAAMLNERPHVRGDNTPYDDLVSVYGEENENYDVVPYGRYWHGYEIFLKPLLLVTSYGEIRRIIMITQIILITIFIVLLVHKKHEKFIIPFVGVWLFFNPVALFLSMQYNSIFILTLLSLIAILLFENNYASNENLWFYHFFLVGCLTSYFDFLTYPLVTFGIPIAFLLVVHGKSFKESFILLVKCGILWALGYVMMWAGKWVIGSLVSGTNILANAKNALIGRSSSIIDYGEGKEKFTISYFTVLIRNLISGYTIIIAFFTGLAIFVSNKSKGKIIDKKNYILAIVALMPFAWYFVTKNHSYIHSWMTYRELGISVYAWLLFAIL